MLKRHSLPFILYFGVFLIQAVGIALLLTLFDLRNSNNAFVAPLVGALASGAAVVLANASNAVKVGKTKKRSSALIILKSFSPLISTLYTRLSIARARAKRLENDDLNDSVMELEQGIFRQWVMEDLSWTANAFEAIAPSKVLSVPGYSSLPAHEEIRKLIKELSEKWDDRAARKRLIPLTQVRLYVVGPAVPHPCGDCPVL